MIRNIPNGYGRELLMAELDALGFQDTYDFLYLPIDTSTLCSVGYAFVNFEHPADAKRCQEVVQGHRFAHYMGKSKRRVAHVSVAHLQGLERNLKHYSCTAVLAIASDCCK